MKPDRYSIIIAFAHNPAISKASHYFFGYRGKFFPIPKKAGPPTRLLPRPEITRRCLALASLAASCARLTDSAVSTNVAPSQPGHGPECRFGRQARSNFGAAGRVPSRRCALLSARHSAATGRRGASPDVQAQDDESTAGAKPAQHGQTGGAVPRRRGIGRAA
jgi:hypothetical protein